MLPGSTAAKDWYGHVGLVLPAWAVELPMTVVAVLREKTWPFQQRDHMLPVAPVLLEVWAAVSLRPSM